jgi:hypothetical protein
MPPGHQLRHQTPPDDPAPAGHEHSHNITLLIRSWLSSRDKTARQHVTWDAHRTAAALESRQTGPRRSRRSKAARPRPEEHWRRRPIEALAVLGGERLVRSGCNSLTLSAPRTCSVSALMRWETSDAMVSRRRPRSVNSRAYWRLSLRSRPLATRVLGPRPSSCAPLRSSAPCASPPISAWVPVRARPAHDRDRDAAGRSARRHVFCHGLPTTRSLRTISLGRARTRHVPG